MLVQPFEEAPLLHKSQHDRPLSRFGPQDPGRKWRQPSWGFRSAIMRREAPYESVCSTGPNHEGVPVEPTRSVELNGDEFSINANDFVMEHGDLETMSTTTGHLSRSICEAVQLGRSMPWQRQARRFYRWLIPFTMAEVFALCAPAAYMYWHLAATWSSKDWRVVLAAIPDSVAVGAWVLCSAAVVVNYAYHFFRLRGTEVAPELPYGEALTHVVIVCSYKEPIEVLTRTFDSIAEQRGLRQPPIAVFAAESRDPSWQDAYGEVKKVCSGRLARLMSTEHILCEGECAGKSANENWAAREVFRQLVDGQGENPFEIMITIVDADSILSPTYLAHVEASFRSQPDGRRLVYNGPLNVYRNFSEAGALVQCLELVRCHQDAFHSLFSVPYPFSNYSLTLGFAAEIGFWTPDIMPEDIHTVNKAMVNSFGSRTTVTIPAIICNDLVASTGDRYQQAKRHQWGSVTELAWLGSVFQDMGLRFPAWWAVFSAEACRAGSFISTVACFAASLIEAAFIVVMALNWDYVPDKAKLFLSLAGLLVAWQWLWFWIAEIFLWQTLLRQFPIERPSLARWMLLVLVMPLLHTVNRIVFLIAPTAHALYHAVFLGELAYVCAPKGNRRAVLPEGHDKYDGMVPASPA
mmetsp:Transcript_104138/g.269661  ORF Transcript_104138/g.269661 Transcript_104138/m.269661 type:complete len:635 (+) Transcript_104138:149-2053(+)